jgi:hypothetical protein
MTTARWGCSDVLVVLTVPVQKMDCDVADVMYECSYRRLRAQRQQKVQRGRITTSITLSDFERPERHPATSENMVKGVLTVMSMYTRPHRSPVEHVAESLSQEELGHCTNRKDLVSHTLHEPNDIGSHPLFAVSPRPSFGSGGEKLEHMPPDSAGPRAVDDGHTYSKSPLDLSSRWSNLSSPASNRSLNDPSTRLSPPLRQLRASYFD